MVANHQGVRDQGRIRGVGHAETWDELTIDGNVMAKDCLLRYKRNGRVLAAASIYRDVESLEAELATERNSAKELRAAGQGKQPGALPVLDARSSRTFSIHGKSSDCWKRMASISACPPATNALPSISYSRLL
jgi:hypothetical protein